MLEYMLDTNIVIYAIRNRPEGVRDAFKWHRGIEGRKACHPLDCRIALGAVASELASCDDLEAIAALFAVGRCFAPARRHPKQDSL